MRFLKYLFKKSKLLNKFTHFLKFLIKKFKNLQEKINNLDKNNEDITDNNVTKNNYLKSIKTFACWCKKKGIIKIDLIFEKFPTVIKPIITLTDEELSILQHSTLPRSERQQVDIFLKLTNLLEIIP